MPWNGLWAWRGNCASEELCNENRQGLSCREERRPYDRHCVWTSMVCCGFGSTLGVYLPEVLWSPRGAQKWWLRSHQRFGMWEKAQEIWSAQGVSDRRGDRGIRQGEGRPYNYFQMSDYPSWVAPPAKVNNSGRVVSAEARLWVRMIR